MVEKLDDGVVMREPECTDPQLPNRDTENGRVLVEGFRWHRRGKAGRRFQVGVGPDGPVFAPPGCVPKRGLKGGLEDRAVDSRVREQRNQKGQYRLPWGSRTLTWRDAAGDKHTSYLVWLDVEQLPAELQETLATWDRGALETAA